MLKKHLFSKKDAKPGLIRWILVLQEFDCEIRDRKGSKNLVADHLSPIIVESESTISECFPDEQLLMVQSKPWYADIVNYLVTGEIPMGWSKHDKNRFFSLVKFFYWDNPYLFKYCPDQIFRRCILNNEIRNVLSFCHDQASGSILVEGKQLPKSFNVVCIGLPYSKMPICTIRVVLGVNSLGKSVGEM